MKLSEKKQQQKTHKKKSAKIYLSRSASDSRARGLGLDTRFGHLLSFLLSLIHEGQLSVAGESMCT